MLHFASHFSPKSIFIAKEGMFRRGTIIGVVVTALFVAVDRHDPTMDWGSWQSIALVAMCFLLWTIGPGWLIGAAMWSIREQAARRNRNRRS
ncbi:MAG TPA: hypothetical protein VJN70_16455 [Gemmatimonadaceae bacterium]|nr:hypothetical protein [Gemmatimonadaceae bacterium]